MRASRSQWNTCSNFRIDHDHKPEAQAKGVRKCLSFNALRLRFRLVASDFFPGIVCILDGDRLGAVELGAKESLFACDVPPLFPSAEPSSPSFRPWPPVRSATST